MSFLHRKQPEPKLTSKDIDPDAVSVLRRLNKSGYVAYLVGGSVRDLLLGREPKDFDIATSASPRQIKSIFRNSFLIGRRFRLALIRFGDKQIETSTFRRSPESEDIEAADAAALGGLYQEADNLFGTPEEDAQRRDFTVNALFYDVTSSKIIDYTGGLRDVAKKVLRCIGDPNIRFREDPVRMLRAIRLSARLDFTIHSDSAKAIAKHSDEIVQASKPRLFEELTRLFTYNKSEEAFRRLWSSGLMHALLPRLDEHVSQSGKKKSDLWHFLAALDATTPHLDGAIKGSPYTILESPLRLAVLLAPLYLKRCLDESTKGRVDALGIAEKLVNDIFVLPFSTPSWRIPRFLCQDTISILESLSYYKSHTIKRNRFFRQDWFYTAMVFWRICAEARDDRTAVSVIESWETAFDEFVVEYRPRKHNSDSAPPPPETFESEDEQRDSLFPPKKHSRRRNRNRSPKSEAGASTEKTEPSNET